MFLMQWKNKVAPAMLVVVTLVFAASEAAAQTAELPRHREPYSWASGRHDGDAGLGVQSTERAAHTVWMPGSPWMQLEFRNAHLGQGSYLEITSSADGASQRLDEVTLKQWGYRSAYFNGDTLEVRLFVAAEDRGVTFEVSGVVVGDQGPGKKSICGLDDRVASTDPHVARIDPIGCTGWIAQNGALLTAGHCLAGSGNNTLSFNPPPSLPNGTVQFPPPEDQYAINQSSFQFVNGGVGNDWGIFDVFDNTQTGLQPIYVQGSIAVRQDLGPATIRVTGFGVDTGTTNQTNQTNTGPNAGSSGTTLRYVVDTQGGNSGSPVIDEATGESIGIHTHGGCTFSGGNNHGTSFFNTALWNALDARGSFTTPPEYPVGSATSRQVTHDVDAFALCASGGVEPLTSSGYCYVNQDGDDDTWELIANHAACNFMCLEKSAVCSSFSFREILLTGTSQYVLDDNSYTYCATAGAIPGSGYCYVNHDGDDDTWELIAHQASWCNFVCARSGCPEVSSHHEILLTGTSTYTASGSSHLYCAIGGAIPNGTCQVDFDGTDWQLSAVGAQWCNFMCIRQ